MRNEGKRKGLGGRALLWAALLSAFLFAVSPALAEGGSGRETVASEGAAWLLSAGEAALRAAEKNADPTKTASWVQKIWEDSAYSGKRPASIRCRLYRNGAAMAQTVTLREGNKWHAGIGGLDRYEETGKEIEWVWKEIGSSDNGYYAQEPPRIEPHTEIIGIVEYTGTQTVLVNRLTVAQLTIEKIWLDDTAKDRPKALTVTLTREDAAGKAYAGDEGTRTVTLTAADGTDDGRWQRTVPNLPVREGDVWRVAETVPKGYRAEGEAGSAETVSGAITPDRLTLTNRKEHRPPSGGGGSGQGGGRRTAPLEPEEEPEDALPEEIPDVGAPWRTLAILLLSGLALLGVGAVLACAGKRTRRLGYGAMAFGVALAALTIPFASRYLSESGASAGMLESVRAELAAALWGGAPAHESAEQPEETGPDGATGRPEAQEAESGGQTLLENGQDINSRAQPEDGPDESGKAGENGIAGPGGPPETHAGDGADGRNAADGRPAGEGHPEASEETGTNGKAAGNGENAKYADPAAEEQAGARGERAGGGETGNGAAQVAEEEPGKGSGPDGRGGSGAGEGAAGQPERKPDPAEEARVKELARKLSDHALFAIRQAIDPAPAAAAPENGDAKRADPEEAARGVSAGEKDEREPAEEEAASGQNGEPRPEEASRGVSTVAGDGQEPAEEAAASGRTVEPGQEEATQSVSAVEKVEREPAEGANPSGQNGEPGPEETTQGVSAAAGDGQEPAEEAARAAKTGEQELPVRWINGRRYVGTASAPHLALTWPVQADWRGDCLSVSPGVFCGNPYGDRFILIGHNYPTHFGTIEDLQPGDEVVFTDLGDSGFRYSVIRTDYLMPDEMEALLDDPAALTLVTCARDGNRRVAVRCERTE